MKAAPFSIMPPAGKMPLATGEARQDDNLAWDDLSPLLASDLSPLPGAVVPQFIRCGKLGCHCQTGERHGPYYYRIWREGQKVRKVYVKATDVEQVLLQCALYQACSDRLRRLAVERSQLWERRLQYSKQLAELVEWGKGQDKLARFRPLGKVREHRED